MTGDELKRIREGLSLSLSQMADILRIDTESVRFMENGKKRVSGPVSALAELLDQGYIDHLRPEGG